MAKPIAGPTNTSTFKYKHIKPSDQAENPFVTLISDQDIAVIPEFQLESGERLQNVPVAYKTFGTLSPDADNAMVICHALTGSADVKDWWGPILGEGTDGIVTAGDTSRFFVICMNSLGSPYGSASPVTAKNGRATNEHYGPHFPLTTIRDDVNIFKLVLDDLGVKQIATVIGGSMGGMLVLEFAYFGKDYVRTIIPIATSAQYSAWAISWGEVQRQSIYSDRRYKDGYYAFDDPPSTGLAAARLSALLTYRSRDSFEARFGRKILDASSPASGNFGIHNEGHRNVGPPRHPARGAKEKLEESASSEPVHTMDPQFSRAAATREMKKTHISTYYSAQSYLRYQGERFTNRFDTNCYLAMTRKLDTHDVTRGRIDEVDLGLDAALQVQKALALIEQPTLVLGIPSDGLFPYREQQELARAIPNCELRTIDSPDGHDAFLLEFRQVNKYLLDFMRRELADIMVREPINPPKTEKKARVSLPNRARM